MEVDDFEDEAQRDAESYTTRRKDQAAAKALKEENRRRKQLGLSPARKPKSDIARTAGEHGPNSPRRRLFAQQPATDGLLSDSDSDEEDSGSAVGEKRKRVSDKDLVYEGRESRSYRFGI